MKPSHHRHPLKGTGIRLHPYHYWLALVVMASLAISGLLWSTLHDLLHWEDVPMVRKLLVAHGGFGFASLVLLGAMLPQHVRFAWVARRNMATGITAILVFLLLIVTAFGLYYGPEEWNAFTKQAHLIIGIAAVAAIPVHIVVGRFKQGTYRRSGNR